MPHKFAKKFDVWGSMFEVQKNRNFPFVGRIQQPRTSKIKPQTPELPLP